MKLVKIRRRKISKVPIVITLPEEFIRVNKLTPRDHLIYFLSEQGDLIIKKEVASDRIKRGLKAVKQSVSSKGSGMESAVSGKDG